MTDCILVVPNKEVAMVSFTGLFIIGHIAVIGNLLIMLTVIKDPLKKLHKPFNFFLVNLALTDLLAGCIIIILTAQCIDRYRAGLGLPIGGLIDCLSAISATSVLMSTIALSLDRLIAITRPIKYRQDLSWRRCIVISMVIWCLSIGIGVLETQTTNEKVKQVLSMAYNYGFQFGGILIMGVVYYRVNSFLRSHEEEFRAMLEQALTATEKTIAQRCSTEKKINATFLAFLLALIFTYIPGFIFLVAYWYCRQCDCQLKISLLLMRYLLLVSNSACNLFICTVRLKDFKKSILALFKRTKRAKRSTITTT